MFKSYASQLHTRSLQIKEVGISSKLLNDWIEFGIVNKVEVEDNKWRLFSLSEAIWIKFVGELRYFGVSISQIKILIETICEFNKEFIYKIYESLIAVPNSGANESLGFLKNKLKEVHNKSEAQLKNEYDDFGLSFFDSIMLYTLIFDLELVFCFTKSTWKFVDYNNKFGQEFGLNNLDDWHKLIGKESYAVINMKSIYKEFFSNDKLKQTDHFYFGIVTEKEKELLQYIKSGDYSTINIKVEEGVIKLTKLTKKDGGRLMHQIARLLKKGDFKEISFVSRDGKVVRYEEIDIVK
jgi:DNA-binding transcriptional MerR regulator